MEKIDKTLPTVLNRVNKLSQSKSLPHQYLWLKVNFSIARDGVIKDLGNKGFCIFIIIRCFMNKHCVAYPSLSLICELSGIRSKNTIQKEINKLEAKGWLKKKGRLRNADGSYGNMQYQILHKDLIRGTNDPSFMKVPISKIDTGYSTDQ